MPQDDLNVGLLMFIAYREMERRVLDAVVAAGFDDITLAQARVFQRIGPDGTRLGELAEQAQVTKQTAGFLVDQLERAGYVERVADPADARAKLVRIAEKGRAAGSIAGRTVAEVEAEWHAHLGRQRMDQLREALSRLREITDRYAR
ncbi:MarR family winged helix-turn-helix transcriptional regulator [Actinoplanes aureus]|jgi:DNA-binding MarR family transcriptional regulator|uniref:MarR family transcriptional regulator n=1 Tax=Actinoplanes aureus TaxID=2792083 RepID=A0A931C7E1_9ACTN|nr:MarR family transcriptional regulator [Actinoplanes aureus]MBG0560853.1 MarR family transcriptional regulator [Actinoplanes aureus]